MEPHHLHQVFHHNQQQIQIIPPSFSSHHHQSHEVATTTATTTSTDRFPQWSIQETKEFLMIRSELDQAFMETKRNKQLWQVISDNMKEKGYHRSAEQCKCKWKNLVTRYKGCETMEVEAMRQQQFPFYNELQSIFTSRMHRMLWNEAEGTSKKNKAMHHHHHQNLSLEDEEENIISNELLESEDQQQKGIKRKKKKAKIIGGGNRNSTTSGNNNDKNMLNSLKKILEDFMRQQMQIEAQWMEAYEARENERRMKEMEWRQTMEALENERLIMDQRWREREEEMMIREEARAEKRDALITALLNKLQREEI